VIGSSVWVPLRKRHANKYKQLKYRYLQIITVGIKFDIGQVTHECRTLIQLHPQRIKPVG